MADTQIPVSDRRLQGFFTVDNDVFSRDRNISAHALLVYCVLARLVVEKSGEATANRGYIAKIARISVGSVSKAINELDCLGLISIEHRREGRKNLPSRYFLNKVCPSTYDRQPMTVIGCTLSTNALLSTDVIKDNPSGEEEALEISSEEKDSPRARVRRVFAHYLEKFGRRPRMYELTPKRMKIGLVRLEECKRKCGGDHDKAEELMCLVVDELSESSFHLGKNEAKERYIDWIDHLFKNSEKLDWWLRKLGVE